MAKKCQNNENRILANRNGDPRVSVGFNKYIGRMCPNVKANNFMVMVMIVRLYNGDLHVCCLLRRGSVSTCVAN